MGYYTILLPSKEVIHKQCLTFNAFEAFTLHMTLTLNTSMNAQLHNCM